MLGLRVHRITVLVALVFAISCRNGVESRPAPPSSTPAAPTAERSPVGATPSRESVSEPSARATPSSTPTARWPLHDAPAVRTEWCIEGIDALDEETCYVLPATPTTTLLVYLHGVVPPEKTSVQKTNFETAVANAARRAGVAALMPRGNQGFTSKSRQGWWGWPTGGSAYERHATGLVARIADKQQKLERIAGGAFTRKYVAGSSSGAYFAAALALRGGIVADGFGAMSGGAGSKTPELARITPKPFYIGYGTHDSVGPSARALAEVLRGAGWPVRIAAHPVGHGAKEIYIDEALAFFRESERD